MAELKSIPFGRILKWLKKSVVKKITMLGGNSYFYIKYENDASIMIIGKEGEHHYIDQLFWNLVCARMDALPVEERGKSNKYSNTKDWKNPNCVYAPNVPAICKAYIEDKVNNGTVQ